MMKTWPPDFGRREEKNFAKENERSSVAIANSPLLYFGLILPLFTAFSAKLSSSFPSESSIRIRHAHKQTEREVPPPLFLPREYGADVDEESFPPPSPQRAGLENVSLLAYVLIPLKKCTYMQADICTRSIYCRDPRGGGGWGK